MNIMLCNLHFHRLYNLHIQIFLNAWRVFRVAERWRTTEGGEERRAVTLDTMRIPAQCSVPHQTSAWENIRQKKLEKISVKKYFENIFILNSKAFLVREIQTLLLSWIKQTIWRETMTDVTVTFWLEGILLPVISVFGLIGNKNWSEKGLALDTVY